MAEYQRLGGVGQDAESPRRMNSSRVWVTIAASTALGTAALLATLAVQRQLRVDAAATRASIATPAPLVTVTGGDVDEHGCIPSAGYQWCAATSSCIRPWEHNLGTDELLKGHCERSQQCNCPPAEVIWECSQEEYGSVMNGSTCEFYKSLETPPRSASQGRLSAIPVPLALAGGDVDEHGCIPSAGYQWCAATSSCIRPWEHNLRTEETLKGHCERSQQCSCPPAEVIWECSQEEHDSVMDGSTCEFYKSLETSPRSAFQARLRGAASPSCSVACSSRDDVSLKCRSCATGMSVQEFCVVCTTEGLNDVGCRFCPASRDTAS